MCSPSRWPPAGRRTRDFEEAAKLQFVETTIDGAYMAIKVLFTQLECDVSKLVG